MTNTPAVRDNADITHYDALDFASLAERAQKTVNDVLNGGFSQAQKEEFIGVPFMLIGWRLVDGDYGAPFAVLYCVSQDDRRLVFTDGGAGIPTALQTFEQNGVTPPILCEEGFRVSDYTYTDAKGNSAQARTYYLG